MSEHNKTYRLRTKIGVTANSPIEEKYLQVNLNNSFDTIEVMSMKIHQENSYRKTQGNYGVIVGRAIANGGFGVPNVKVSVFIPADEVTLSDVIQRYLYPYNSSTGRNEDGIPYNLLPDSLDKDGCYAAVGTFPNKRLVLDDDNYIEVYGKYYKFTTRTNNAGDYMIFGVPTGSQTLHVDMDLSDIGVLSQKPRDMIYNGYSADEFESSVQFKTSTKIHDLPQIISQDTSVFVYPFWGDETNTLIGITRYDIDIDYKFQPTCVFMGSIVSDSSSNKISKKCTPSVSMGFMEDLVTGRGRIEMIRKTITGGVEEFSIQGTRLIAENGVWCYQIPMNLDYMMTDEYGNLVPSDNPEVGIPTRAKVRFRISMDDLAEDNANCFRGKVLVPNNPQINSDGSLAPDYVFGTLTDESSYRDLLWNNVYTVKSFIPRFQKGNSDKNRRFSGFKGVNYYASNNPIPYNNIRIRMSFQFRMACLIIKVLLTLMGIYNKVMGMLASVLLSLPRPPDTRIKIFHKRIPLLPITGFLRKISTNLKKSGRLGCLYMDGSICETLEDDWYFAPNCPSSTGKVSVMWKNSMAAIEGKKNGEDGDFSKKYKGDGSVDMVAIDTNNRESAEEKAEGGITAEGQKFDYVLSRGIDYFMECAEITLAEEHKVIQFDFYNDWLNGTIYIPRWERSIKRKRKYFFFGKKKTKIRACNELYSTNKIKLTEQCAVTVRTQKNTLSSKIGCKSNKTFRCHKKAGRKQVNVFKNEGVVHSQLTSTDLYAYYFKPCELVDVNGQKKKLNLFATDIVLLGSLNKYNISETPMFIDALQPTSYQLPDPLATTDATEEGFSYGLTDSPNILTAATFSGVYVINNAALKTISDGGFTEASGVDWGFTGPGQGEKNKKKNYIPGGHFLGISCMNAETTTKSCINVKRICEAGVSPSVSYQVSNGFERQNGNVVHGSDETFVESIANGLITKDEILEGDFRKLFATLNFNGLAVETDEHNYTKYKFVSLSPENFGGEMANYANENYNAVVYQPNASGNDETISAYTESDEFKNENIKAIVRRSLEERDDDYMRFRLGIPTLSQSAIQKKYLIEEDTGYAMPVYENSFYFYFGLKNGATALDEFREKYYAECQIVSDTTDKLPVELLRGAGSIRDDMFKHDTILNIFNTTGYSVVDNNVEFHIHSESYPITITHYYNGESSMATITEDSDESNGVTVVRYDVLFGTDPMGIGPHTFVITDADGRNTTKIARIRSEELEICNNVSGIDFNDINWVAKTQQELLDPSNNRLAIGGYISVGCDTLFKYNDIEVPLSAVGVVLVSGTRALYNNLVIPNVDIPLIAENLTPVSGLSSLNNCIPVDDITVYDMYAFYISGNTRSVPILIARGIEIDEPETVDFTIFRTTVGDSEESVNSYRRSYIKFRGNVTWYNNIDGLANLTEEKKWYLKKDVYYLRDANTDYELSSERTLDVTIFYPSTMPLPSSTVYTINTKTALSVPYNVQITYGDNQKCPENQPFVFRTIQKPFFYKAVVWEGFADVTGTTFADIIFRTAGISGKVYNGITYNREFGDFIVNDDFLTERAVATQSDSSSAMRETNIPVLANRDIENFSSYPEISFAITEGSPNSYDPNYEPETVYLAAPAIGTSEGWDVVLNAIVSGTNNNLLLVINNEEPLTYMPTEGIYVNDVYSNPINMYASTNDNTDITTGFNITNATTMTWSDTYSGFTYQLPGRGVIAPPYLNLFGEVLTSSQQGSQECILKTRNLIRRQLGVNTPNNNWQTSFYYKPRKGYFGFMRGDHFGGVTLGFVISLPFEVSMASKIVGNIESAIVYFIDNDGYKYIDLMEAGLTPVFNQKWKKTEGQTDFNVCSVKFVVDDSAESINSKADYSGNTVNQTEHDNYAPPATISEEPKKATIQELVNLGNRFKEMRKVYPQPGYGNNYADKYCVVLETGTMETENGDVRLKIVQTYHSVITKTPKLDDGD